MDLEINDLNEAIDTLTSVLRWLTVLQVATTNGNKPPSEEKPIPSVSEDISQLQAIILAKYRKQIISPPSVNHCRRALEQFPITALEEAITRCSAVLRDGTTASNIINMVIKYAENSTWGRPKEETHPGKLPAGKKEDLEHELKLLEEDFSDALLAESEKFVAGSPPVSLPDSKQDYLDQEIKKINNIRRVLEMPLKERVVLDNDDVPV